MIIDAHTHIFPPAFREQRDELVRRDPTFAELYANPRAALASAEDLIEAMDSAEVDLAVAVGIGWSDPALASRANDYLIEVVARHPRRLAGFCAVDPAWGDAALKEVERCLAAGLTGVGELHPDTQGFQLEDEDSLAGLMTLAQTKDIPVLVHASEPVGHVYRGKGRATPQRVLRLVQGFPQTTIICAHWGGGLPFYALMPEVASALANTYFDSAASPLLYHQRVFSVAAEAVGPDRILFASDFPLVKPQRILAQVRDSGLPAAAQAMIAGGNAMRLLGLEQGAAAAAPKPGP